MLNETERSLLKEYQGELLEMLLAFDAFSKEHHIPYFMAGGTALGVVRHKGIIPWDDDIDLSMFRPDFERMEKIFAENDNVMGKYKYSPVFHQIVNDAPIGHLFYLPEGDYDKADAPMIDFHPIDGLPKSGFMKLVQRFFAIVHYMSIYRLPTKNKGKAAHFISKALVTILPDKGFDFFARMSYKVITAWPPKEDGRVCCLFGLAGYENECMDVDLLLPAQTAPFEGHMFPLPGKEEEYLDKLYGDYRQVPPPEKQIPKHTGYQRFIEAMHKK